MKKIVFSIALTAICSVAMFAQEAKPVRLSTTEIQQKGEAAAAQFVARYNLNAEQAAQAKSLQIAMVEKIASMTDEKGNVNAADLAVLKTSVMEGIARFMTAPQRKQLLADYQAGMYK
jgi:hypothetical protein